VRRSVSLEFRQTPGQELIDKNRKNYQKNINPEIVPVEQDTRLWVPGTTSGQPAAPAMLSVVTSKLKCILLCSLSSVGNQSRCCGNNDPLGGKTLESNLRSHTLSACQHRQSLSVTQLLLCLYLSGRQLLVDQARWRWSFFSVALYGVKSCLVTVPPA
jgi:hypothetical protein